MARRSTTSPDTTDDAADGAPVAKAAPPLTPDARYIVVRGRLWRAADPTLPPERRDALVRDLMDARRAVGRAKRGRDAAADTAAYAAVQAAKVALGERGAPWWSDGAPDLNRHLARNTGYADWYATLTADASNAPLSVRVGTAAWSIPRAAADAFAGGGSHLERYAAVMPAVEINSSFYRPHRRSTYERWAAATPDEFRFSVKIPKEISHVRRLVEAAEPLDAFIEQVGGLGGKLGVLLLQLPPSLVFDRAVAAGFLDVLRRRIGEDVGIACEPRHATWFTADAEACLIDHRVARVMADPVLAPGGARPGGWTRLRYRRLHGSPRIYRSSYDAPFLAALAEQIARDDPPGGASWCIFDNTASGAATSDALRLLAELATAACR